MLTTFSVSRGSARVLIMLVGLSGIAWCAVLLPQSLAGVQKRNVASRVLIGDAFKLDVLKDVLRSSSPSIQSHSIERSDLVRSEALIRQGIARESLHRAAEGADQDAAKAEESLRFSLSINPADSFSWLMLYFLENQRNGFSVDRLAFLKQSYVTASRDAWIALRRNKVALAVYPLLSMETQSAVISEFDGLVDSGFFEQAGGSLVGATDGLRDRLIASLAQLDIVAREEFARTLARDGVSIAIPGVRVDDRQWQR